MIFEYARVIITVDDDYYITTVGINVKTRVITMSRESIPPLVAGDCGEVSAHDNRPERDLEITCWAVKSIHKLVTICLVPNVIVQFFFSHFLFARMGSRHSFSSRTGTHGR